MKLETSRVLPFRDAGELWENAARCIAELGDGEDPPPDVRSRADAIARRIAVVWDDAPPYVAALHAWRLDPIAMWLVHAAVAAELDGHAPRTFGDCARIAGALTGAPRTDGFAAGFRARDLALIEVCGDEPLHARPVRVAPRVLELAVGHDAPPLPVLRVPDGVAVEGALAERIVAGLAASPQAHRIGDRASLPAIVAVAAAHGLPVVVAGPGVEPAVGVREALLVDGVLVAIGAPDHHPAWSAQRRGVLALT